jgi:inner membrane protein
MDSITQIVLGAAIGELIAGRRVGHRAALWGAIGGTIPDLDVLTALFLNPVDYLAAHRGFSHSIFFAFLVAPLVAYIPHRLYQALNATYSDWVKVMFWSLFTHPILDTFTGYGTQLLNPFFDYAFEINSIFIIDPLFTLPLLICLFFAVRTPISNPKRSKWIQTGLLISILYLSLTVILKVTAYHAIKNDATKAGIEINRMMTIPGPFSSILWRGLIESDEGFYQGYYSVFDGKNKSIDFHFLPHSRQILDHRSSESAVRRLVWFSKGFYIVHAIDNDYILNDLRFGSYRGWIGEHELYIFSFQIYKDEDDGYTFNQITNSVDVQKSDFVTLFNRTFAISSTSDDLLKHTSIGNLSD